MRSPVVSPAGTVLQAGRGATNSEFYGLDAAHQVELLALEADSQATRESAIQEQRSAKAVQVVVKTANKVGTTATYTPSLQRLNLDGTYSTVWTATSPLTANGTAIYELGEVSGAAGGEVIERVSIVLPVYWRFVLTAATADGSNNMDTYAEADVIV